MVTEEEWHGEVAKGRRLRFVSAIAGVVFCSGMVFLAMLVGNAVSSGLAAMLISAGIFIAMSIPIIAVLMLLADRQQGQSDEKVMMLTAELTEALGAAATEAGIRDVQVQRQEFESRLANALDMAGGEPEVVDVIQRSFSTVLPEGAVELLLADNSHAHLTRMTGVAPDGGDMPSCTVDSPDQCPAARRAQIQVFSDSDDLDACPKLRNRPQGRLSALCVPVSVMGRAVGVIHATGQPEDDVEENQISDLSTLAKLAGARIGLLRVMAETQLQASTDTLTGLLNRRSFSELVSQVPLRQHPMAVAMADLDHFKVLNDTYGHDTGDRALRLFARVMRDTLRTSDLVCRYGGEEFAVAFPDCAAADAMHAIESVRAQLDAAITVAGLPKFTASYGVTDKEPGEQLEGAMRRADDALLSAKREGRDQVVHHDAGITQTNATGTNGHATNGHDVNGARRRNGNSHSPLLVESPPLAAPEVL
jgi:diguanylate cyclase (GGDEF)-like protein